MSFYINKVTVEGIVGAKPQITLKKEIQIVQFPFMTKERWLSRQGDKMEKSNWFIVETIVSKGEDIKVKEGTHYLIDGYIQQHKSDFAGPIKINATTIREVIPHNEEWLNSVIISGKIHSSIQNMKLGSKTDLCFFTLSFHDSQDQTSKKKSWVKVELLGSNVKKYNSQLVTGIDVAVVGFLRFDKYLEDKSIVKIRAYSVQRVLDN